MQQDPKIIECELFELMVQASPVASMLADENGLILVVNRAAEELLDCDSTQLIQRPLADLIPCAHNYAHARLSSPTSADRNDQGQDAFKSSLILRERLPLGVDGDPVTAEVSLYSIRPRGRIFTLANIADPFYTQVGQFPDPKLDAIAEMIRGLAHECRNALQRARGCLDLLELDLVAQPQLSELAGRIRRSLEDLEHNYNEVRDFAAPIVLERQDCNVEQLLLSVYRELSSQEDSQVGQLLTNIPNDCRLNRMDPQRMAVVFRNLMVNAWQASPAGADLVARVQHVDYLRRSWQRIEIQDFGGGISDEIRARVFEPFFTTKQKGNGLGLAICRRIVEAHGGYIAVAASQPDGEGTTLRIDLPFSTVV